MKWVEFAYDITPRIATNLSPYVLWFGRKPRTPLEAQIPLVKIADDQAILPDDTPLENQELDFIELDKDLCMDRNLKDTLLSDASDAWIPTFVCEESELELVPGQTGYDSIDTSAESVHFPSQLNIGEVPDRAGVAVVPISRIPAFTSTPELQFNQERMKEAKELAIYNGAS